jgi:hypothetical protein
MKHLGGTQLQSSRQSSVVLASCRNHRLALRQIAQANRSECSAFNSCPPATRNSKASATPLTVYLFSLQLFAGNTGWATPAGLGFSLAQQRAGRRLVVCQGDGGLQMP